MTVAETINLLIAICALIGAVLGVYNFIHNRARERVRLKITPFAAYATVRDHTGRVGHLRMFTGLRDGKVPDFLSVDIVNLSGFNVMVSEVGFKIRRSRTRIVVSIPILADDGPFPRKLGPRDGFTVHFIPDHMREARDPASISAVYASTKCGTTATGSSPAFRQLIELFVAERTA